MHNDPTIAARRFRRALYDLGLEPITGSGWCSFADGSLVFAPLDARRADRLIGALEDIAERLPAVGPPVPGPGQLSLRWPSGEAPGRARLRLVLSDRSGLART
jgi:hypothetical protein